MDVKEMADFSKYSISRIYEHVQKIRLLDKDYAVGPDGRIFFNAEQSAAYMKMLNTIETTGSVNQGIVALFKTLGKYEYLYGK